MSTRFDNGPDVPLSNIRDRISRSRSPSSHPISSKPPLMAGSRMAWALPVSPTCLPNGQGSTRCLAFRRTDPAFEPSLYQRQSPPPGNAIFQGRDKDPETVPAIQSADCRDKMRAQIAASSGRFAPKPGNPRLLRTAWWAREDSNFQPNDYQPLALSSLWRFPG